ncbi:hypothetical protein I317_02606 [Kwoniella heveanensis CBS 569]|nr:hypothetical protein I317_02606 [Kwoniella heveanensis CBS 569]
MSDSGGNAGDDDVGLPKATVFKLIQEMLPEDIGCSKEAKDIIVECCVEWVKLISTQSNTVCDESSKKTISPEHVVEALKQLGFEDFISEVEESNKDFKQSQKVRHAHLPRPANVQSLYPTACIPSSSLLARDGVPTYP